MQDLVILNAGLLRGQDGKRIELSERLIIAIIDFLRLILQYNVVEEVRIQLKKILLVVGVIVISCD